MVIVKETDVLNFLVADSKDWLGSPVKSKLFGLIHEKWSAAVNF